MIDKFENSPKEFWALLIIPLELIIGNFVGQLNFINTDKNISSAFVIFLSILAFSIMIFAFRKFLISQWLLYWTKWGWLKFIINIGLVYFATFILSLTRTFISSLTVNPKQLLITTGLTLLLNAIPPFLAPFTEELTFRYLLFGKFSKKSIKWTMFLISSVLFGLIHLANFNGNIIQTIPYMIIGAYFSLIYFFYNNIWGSIFTHWMFNTMNALWPALTMIFSGLTFH